MKSLAPTAIYRAVHRSAHRLLANALDWSILRLIQRYEAMQEPTGTAL